MSHHSRRTLLATTFGIAALPMLAVLPARADDRKPTAQERQQIEAVLRREGFVRWGDIEMDDGRWEVDDAVAADGRKYDLELSRQDFSILKRDLDD
ncbi:PepSY domain-containing protein [Phreatobacter sp.]|uniref:PepSY domain-containing protein n=1 Tax=Phreatobacter sp. TaxID=1966341 RepID=UPI003F6F139D